MAQPTKLTKLSIQARNLVKHKGIVRFDEVDGDDDQNYTAASERFLELQTQLSYIIQHAQSFRRKLEDAIEEARLLADDFGRMSQGADRVNDGWAATAHGQAYQLKNLLEDSLEIVKQRLGVELDDRSLATLQAEAERFLDVKRQMKERFELKVEVQHYSTKLQELKDKFETQQAGGKLKVTEEKFERNKEKYATATQHLRDQTNQLMSTYAHAETLRRRVLSDDLPVMMTLQKAVFDAIAVNVTRATQGVPEYSPTPIGARLAASSRGFATGDSSALAFSSAPTGELERTMAEVSLEDDASPRMSNAGGYATGNGGAFGTGGGGGSGGGAAAAFSMKMEPSPPRDSPGGGLLVKKGTPTHLTDNGHRNGSGGSNSLAAEAAGAEFGDQLRLAHEHQSARGTGVGEAGAGADAGGGAAAHAAAANGNGTTTGANGAVAGGALPPPPPGKMYLRALFDYEATQFGDLDFRTNDIIVVDAGDFTGDGWLSGEVGGRSGMFPANYTECV